MTLHDDWEHDAAILNVSARVNVGVPVAKKSMRKLADRRQAALRAAGSHRSDRQDRVTVSSWEAWAPPLAPPTDGGLPVDDAQAIADAWWEDDPHLGGAPMWESYAASLPPTPSVARSRRARRACPTAGRPRAGSWAWRSLVLRGTGRSRRRRRCRCGDRGRSGTRAAGQAVQEPALPGVRRRDRVVPGAPQADVLRAAADAAGLVGDPGRAARCVPLVPGLRPVPANEVHHVISWAGGGARAGEPAVAVPLVPCDDHRHGQAARRGRRLDRDCTGWPPRSHRRAA